MGKKSRQKRERRNAREAISPEALLRDFRALQGRTVNETEAENTFQERLEATRDVLRRYVRKDAAVALGISDLWPANAGSPIKHIYACAVLLDLEQNDSNAMPIKSYADFQAFMGSLAAAWPEFPMLEDFAPEADWGQTRVRLGSNFVPMFYGSCIERTPDFVEAFRITYADNPVALAHMDLAVALQARIIDSIPQLHTEPVPETKRAYVEIPPEGFWESCREVLLQAGCSITHWRHKAGTALETTFGGFKSPLTRNAFGNAAMQGMALPFLAVAEGSDWIPLSVRSAPGVVIDHWASQFDQGTVSLQTHRRLARFVAERYSQTLAGPLTLVVGGVAYEQFPVSCVISAASCVYLICACEHEASARLGRQAKGISEKLQRSVDIHFRLADGRTLLLSKDGVTGPSSNELRILIVLTQKSTAFGTIEMPKEPVRLMPLADFITIFDSLDDLEELERYWKYVDEQRKYLSPFSTGPADLFASFKDSHGVLVEGAMSPNWISLDPHWGTGWRFKVLSAFWSRAPQAFPDGSAGWQLTEGTEGVIELRSRHHKALAYSTLIGTCTVQTLVTIAPDLKITDGRIVDVFAQLLADSLSRCSNLISDVPLFELPHVVISCERNPTSTIDESKAYEPLEIIPDVVTDAFCTEASNVRIHLKLDVLAILTGLNANQNGAFEIRCLVEALSACHTAYGIEIPAGFADRLQAKALEPARYHFRVDDRYVDVPDYVEPIIPLPTEYKLARKKLALALKDLGIVPGRYELSEAKTKIDPAGQGLRIHIETRLASLDRHQLLQACLEQHDALLIAERLKIQRARQSLAHAVDYDRLEAVQHARKEYGSAARHYRYILEKVYSSPATGIHPVEENVLRELVGLVDWYMTLTGASDVLHNGVDVGGVDIDDSFIPEVFYSVNSSDREEQFSREYAKLKLGIGINEKDAVEGATIELLSSQKMRQAFLADLGFELQHLIDTMAILSQAHRHGFGDDLALSYTATPEKIAQVLTKTIDDLPLAESSKIVYFLTLSETDVRRLPGRDIDEIDVPYWEHSKRIHRYAIRPLVRHGDNLLWGAEQASRTLNIWMSSVRDGYLPAEFGWPNIDPIIKQIKNEIEKRLEIRTAEIFKRYTPYVARGIDFFRRFRCEMFDDVGDFDVIAFWPETNRLVTVECKYNQPTYTVKDGRRLRDKIFGKSELDKDGHQSRIFRRQQFVNANRERILELLKWPTPICNTQEDIELYVSRDTYFWMINPPYPVRTVFVRVDTLDSWIKKELIKQPAT